MAKFVLVAEDDETARMNLCAFIRLLGHRCIPTSNGRDAWALIDHDRSFDLIYSDYEMPGMDGLSLLRRVRADEGTKHTPFVLMSGRSTVSDEDQRHLADVCEAFDAAFWSKPINFEEMVARTLGPVRERDDS